MSIKRPNVTGIVWLTALITSLWIGGVAAQDGPVDPPPNPARQALQKAREATEDGAAEALDAAEDAAQEVGDTIQNTAPPVDEAATTPAPEPAAPATPPVKARARAAAQTSYYGYWAFLPALVAILLAALTRQVVPSLFIGLVVGAYMMVMVPDTPAHGAAPARIETSYADTPLALRGARVAVEDYLVRVTAMNSLDPEREGHGHMMIVLFTLLIGGMVGVVSANGGTSAMVRSVAGTASSRSRGQAAGWLAGLIVFFDDYANSMIVGPTMRPLFDRLRISREKLAYIVDSTAAPVASIALIGTWIGAEIDYIDLGLVELAKSAVRPGFIKDINASEAFLYSIPYRFYPIFALMMVLLVALTGRDFGPMRTAERRAAAAPPPAPERDRDGPQGRWWFAGLPILVLISGTMAIIYFTGSAGITGLSGDDLTRYEGMDSTIMQMGMLISQADTTLAILYGALGALVVGVGLTVLTRVITVRKTIEAVVEGMTQMFPAIIILVLAWGLSAVMTDLNMGHAANAFLRNHKAFLQEYINYVPAVIFVTSAVVSFATGTSWGTMGILCPVVVTLVGGELLAGETPDVASRIFYASIGSVLAGAVFGDHCSPISDTTVLSATASGCSLESHVWTQMFYALTAAGVALLCGDLIVMHYERPVWMGFAAGAVVLVMVLYLIGRGSPLAQATAPPPMMKRPPLQPGPPRTPPPPPPPPPPPSIRPGG